MLYLTVIGNEADIIAENLRHHYDMGFRHFYIMFNCSDDATRYAVEGAAAELAGAAWRFFEDDRPGYWQPERLTMMAEEGFLNGLRWMFPRDADELLQAPDGWRDALNKIDEPGYIKCDWVDFAPHAEWNGRHIFGWKARLAPRPQPKLIVHWRPGMQFGWGHHVMWSKEREVENPGFWVAHYPFRSREFVERKIKQIGQAFVDRFGKESLHQQVTNYLEYLEDPKGYMDKQWAWVMEYRGKATQAE